MTKVLRARFVEWLPSPVATLAVSQDASMLAVARQNGNIDLWSSAPARSWVLLGVLPGSPDSPPSALVWAGRALVSSGPSGLITVWNTDSLSPISSTTSLGGPVWSLAVSPVTKTSSSSSSNSIEKTSSGSTTNPDALAAACEDGSVRLFTLSDYSDDGTTLSMVYSRKLSTTTTKRRVVSLAWSPNGKWIVAGGSDGSIRRLNPETGAVLQSIAVESYGRNPTVIWALAVTPDSSTVISGDSGGNTQFWATATGTLIQGFKQHGSDVLAVAVDASGSTVWSAGVDTQIAAFASVGNKWVYSSARRPHTHDVTALAASPAPSSDFLLSGGADSQITLFSASHFGAVAPVKLSPFPRRPVASWASPRSDTSLRLMAFTHDDRVELWALDPQGSAPVLLLALRPKLSSNITTACLSPCGSFLLIADAGATRLYSIVADAPPAVPSHVARTALMESLPAATAAAWCPDSSRAVLAGPWGIAVVEAESGAILRVFPPPGTAPVTLVSISPDGQYAAGADVNGSLYSVNLDGLAPGPTLPSLDAAPTALSFSPHAAATLVATSASNAAFLIDVEAGALTPWSAKYSAKLPSWWLRRKERITGITFNPASPNTIILATPFYFTVIDITKPPPSRSEDVIHVKKATDTSASSPGGNFITIEAYRPLLAVDYTGPDELVVIERPWLAVLGTLGDPMYRHKYGSG